MKTCLFITPFFSPNIGGVETHFDDLLNLSQKYKTRFIVATYKPLNNDKEVPFIEERGNNVIYRLPWYGKGFFQKLENYPALEVLYLFPGVFILSIYLILKHREEISVLHSQGFVSGLVGLLLAWFFGYKSVFTDHTVYNVPPGSLNAQIFSAIANGHDKVLAVSPLAKEELISWEVDESKIEIFRYWANNSVFDFTSKTKARKALGIDKNKKVLLNVARLHPAKGLDILIKAARKLQRQKSEVTFYLVSTAKDKKEFLDFLGIKRLPKNCVFIGRVDYSVLNLWYSSADALIVTSRKEGFSRVNIESMLCGTPVIASRTGSLVDVLNDEVALFADIPEPSEFVDVVNKTFSKKATLAGLSKKAYEYARATFTESNADLIFRTYN